MMEVELAGELVMVPTGRGYRPKRGGPFMVVDQHMGKTWACAKVALPVGSLMETTIPTEEGKDALVRMRVMRPAKKAELNAAAREFPEKVSLAKGHWYEVHAD
jgi:hypothetical protein